MLTNFKSDLERGQRAEKLVQHILKWNGFEVENVSNQPQYYKRGDLLVTLASGEQRFIEVKDDSRIAETKNILCEEENYIKDSDRFIDGGMRYDYDIYCILSRAEGVMYLLDFKKLQQIYKQGEFKVIRHSEQDSYCYLLPLGVAKRKGALMGIIDYKNMGVVNYTLDN